MKKIINILKQPIFLNRFKAFGWSLLYTTLTFALAIANDLVPQLGLSEVMALVVGLIINQLSKLAHELKNKNK